MKQEFMHVDRFKEILIDFVSTFDCIKFLCRKMRSVLFFVIKNEELDFEISIDSKTLYEFIIKAFENAIKSLNTNI